MENFHLYEPVGTTLLLIPKTPKAETEGGIYIPEQARSMVTMGTVLKLGKDAKQFGIGDEVVYVQHTENPIEVDGRKYLLLDEANVVLVKRVASNPDNDVNKLMKDTSSTFEQAQRAYYDVEGDFDKALCILKGYAVE